MSPKIPVVAVVSTYNEERAIAGCLDSLTEFAEVIVFDSQSSDRTAEIARGRGVRVVDFEWNGQYPKKKQWFLDNVETEFAWVFFVDADEKPSTALLREIRGLQLQDQTEVGAFDVELDYVFQGKRLRWGHRVSKRALLKRDAVQFPVVDDLGIPGMGELEGHYQPLSDLPVGRLQERLQHDDPDPVVSWVSRHTRYATWEAGVRLNNASRTVRSRKSRQGRLFDKVPLKPVVFFLYSYVIRLGFLDGSAGFNYAVGLAFYYWQIGMFERDALRQGGHDGAAGS